MSFEPKVGDFYFVNNPHDIKWQKGLRLIIDDKDKKYVKNPLKVIMLGKKIEVYYLTKEYLESIIKEKLIIYVSTNEINDEKK